MAKVTWKEPEKLRKTVEGATRDLTVAGWSAGSLPPPVVESNVLPIIQPKLSKSTEKDGTGRGPKHPDRVMAALEEHARQVWFSSVRTTAALACAGMAMAHMGITCDGPQRFPGDNDAARLDEAWRTVAVVGSFLRDAMVNAGATMASSTLMRRAMWLNGSSDMAEGVVKKLMGAEITPRGLFGITEEMLAELRKQQEGKDTLVKSLLPPQPTPSVPGSTATKGQTGQGEPSKRKKGYTKSRSSKAHEHAKEGSSARSASTDSRPPDAKKSKYGGQAARQGSGSTRNTAYSTRRSC